MPIFIQWKWIEKTETFLTVFHFWDDATRQNLRMRIEEMGYESCVYDGDRASQKEGFIPIETIPCYIRAPTKHDAYLSWAPSHAEFCLLTELLTYANLINGLKPILRKRLREKLQGHAKTKEASGETYVYFSIDSELLKRSPDVKMVCFITEDRISFEVSFLYVEYVRKLVEPFLR